MSGHPFKQHAEHKKSHERVSHILKDEPGGDATASNLDKWSARADANSYARGGRLPTAGARSGVGRLQKAGK